MRLKRMTVPSLLFWLTCLSACGATSTEAPPPTPIPSALFACADRPTPPGADADQRAVALFLIALDAAHAECRARLGTLKRLLHGPNAARPLDRAL